MKSLLIVTLLRVPSAGAYILNWGLDNSIQLLSGPHGGDLQGGVRDFSHSPWGVSHRPDCTGIQRTPIQDVFERLPRSWPLITRHSVGRWMLYWEMLRRHLPRWVVVTNCSLGGTTWGAYEQERWVHLFHWFSICYCYKYKHKGKWVGGALLSVRFSWRRFTLLCVTWSVCRFNACGTQVIHMSWK